ncbi:hypothetical protein L3X39_12420 [Sabulilitoribacter multivorans]|uniref:Lipoprotein n=1 Tax=Flaviramulus multivorans TaxID=1304750 RepID=A0ABS9ILH4_9FLAO|nr:hypothetical protein [Flaviramulus multivorans]MCF7561444.1 hypothetical protein [Flaviramulus multivorans]
MKRIILLLIVSFVFSCGNKKVIELPEINHSQITEVHDVSAAYLFYDETQKDSVELNRKNLISTTNWLVNVDKRLTLKQVIPHIKFLQEKKQNAGHKNENAKNYFTCHDTNRNDLGFVEFTNTKYNIEANYPKIIASVIPKEPMLLLEFKSNGTLLIQDLYANRINPLEVLNLSEISVSELENHLKKEYYGKIILSFQNNLLFQDYISVKSTLSKIDLENIIIWKEEFVLF